MESRLGKCTFNKENTILLESFIPQLEETKGLKFGFNSVRKKAIIGIIVDFVSNNYHVDENDSDNLSLAFSILETAFDEAKAKNHYRLQSSDIADAIRNCDKLYPSIREGYAKIVEERSFSQDFGKPMGRVIPFPRR